MTTTVRQRTATLYELVGDALTNLYDLRRRSFLALLGIAIGTASVVAMLSIGHMAELAAIRVFGRMGLNMLTLHANSDQSFAGLDQAFIENLPSHLAIITAATPLAVGHVEIDTGHTTQPIGIAAVTPALMGLAGLRLSRGRFITTFDNPLLVAVVGAAAATKLSRPDSPLDLGTQVRIGRYLFTIIGILSETQTTGFDPTDYNDALLVPSSSALRALQNPNFNAALAVTRPGIDTTIGASMLESYLKRNSSGSRFQISSAKDIVQAIQAQKAVQARLLAAIGAISLLVGGIGVMNVMLMSVMERRREIGLRAAIGAAPLEIQIMFLVEAAALALAGGIVGTALGVGASAVRSLRHPAGREHCNRSRTCVWSLSGGHGIASASYRSPSCGMMYP
jgi:putative ABC transport system permease protein